MRNVFDSKFEIDESYENENWIRVSIRTFAFGENRNGSNILSSSLTNSSKAQKSLGAIPIVAKYNDEVDDLEGHNTMMREKRDGNGYEMYHDTDALGFTSPVATFRLEEVDEGTSTYPIKKTYVVIEDVYLWKRFDATKRILSWNKEGISTRVSMEIDQVEGHFDSEGYFQIDDFVFTGIAALGTDVEPCFPRAEIQMYTAGEFKRDVKSLMSELNYTLLNEGGDIMSKENKENEEIEVKKEDVSELEDAEKLNIFEDDGDDSDGDDDDSGDDTETDPEDGDGNGETEPEPEPEPEPEVDSSELEDLVGSSDYNSDDYTEDSYSAYSDALAQANSVLGNADATQEDVNNAIQALQNAVNGLEVKPEEKKSKDSDDNTSGSVTVVKRKEFEKEMEEVKKDFADLSTAYSLLKEELNELKSYKRSREEQDLQNKFNTQVSKEEFATLFESMKDSSVEDIEKEVFAIIGKKNFSINNNKTEDVSSKISISSDIQDAASEHPYSALEVYIRKNK